MRGALREAQALKTLWVREHLTPLRGQGDALACKRLLPGHADLQDVLGFLARGKTAEGRQTQGDTSRILGLAHASRLSTRETARKPRRATQKSCRANKTTSTLGRVTSA
jgi:hypothetical protein